MSDHATLSPEELARIQDSTRASHPAGTLVQWGSGAQESSKSASHDTLPSVAPTPQPAAEPRPSFEDAPPPAVASAFQDQPPPELAATLTPAKAAAALRSARSSGPRTVLPAIAGQLHDAQLTPRDEERYEIRRTLGEGAMGEVLLAYDRDIERDVAMKRILPELLEPGFIARFVQEVRALGRLEHPNVLPIYDVGLDEGGELYFTMKYIQGETLEDVIDRLRAGDAATHALFPLSRRLDIFVNVLMALDHAHALGVIHRDVKPENIMVSPGGEVLLVDWGIAHLVTSDLEAGVAGTPAYMAPEQAVGGQPNQRSDVYSAFVVLFELLTLSPYQEEEDNISKLLALVAKKEPPHAFSKVYSEVQPVPVPAQYRHFLVRGLANKPDERFASAHATLEHLALIRSGDFQVQCPATLMRKSHNRMLGFIERYPTTVTASLVLGVLAGVGSALWCALG